jgi:hypothetical protein
MAALQQRPATAARVEAMPAACQQAGSCRTPPPPSPVLIRMESAPPGCSSRKGVASYTCGSSAASGAPVASAALQAQLQCSTDSAGLRQQQQQAQAAGRQLCDTHLALVHKPGAVLASVLRHVLQGELAGGRGGCGREGGPGGLLCWKAQLQKAASAPLKLAAQRRVGGRLAVQYPCHCLPPAPHTYTARTKSQHWRRWQDQQRTGQQPSWLRWGSSPDSGPQQRGSGSAHLQLRPRAAAAPPLLPRSPPAPACPARASPRCPACRPRWVRGAGSARR